MPKVMIQLGLARFLGNIPSIACVVCAAAILTARGPKCEALDCLFMMVVLLHVTPWCCKEGQKAADG